MISEQIKSDSLHWIQYPKVNEMNDKLKEILQTSIYFLVVLIVALLIVTFVGQRTIVDGPSMEDTLFDKDNLIVDKITYRFRDPERFDVIVFPYQYTKRTYFIKRIIGLPGETVFIDTDGNIYINDVLLNEHYCSETIERAGLAGSGVTLGPDEYFVMGDNRNNSLDSRYENVGNIKKKDIIGRAWLRVYPFNRMGFVDKIK